MLALKVVKIDSKLIISLPHKELVKKNGGGGPFKEPSKIKFQILWQSKILLDMLRLRHRAQYQVMVLGLVNLNNYYNMCWKYEVYCALFLRIRKQLANSM